MGPDFLALTSNFLNLATSGVSSPSRGGRPLWEILDPPLVLHQTLRGMCFQRTVFIIDTVKAYPFGTDYRLFSTARFNVSNVFYGLISSFIRSSKNFTFSTRYLAKTHWRIQGPPPACPLLSHYFLLFDTQICET